MRKLLRTLALVGAATGLAMISSALAQKEMTPKKGGILAFGVKAEPPTYDLQGSTSYGTLHHTEQHYSLLLNFDLDNWPALKGDIAESWEESDDHMKFTFKLREGIKFHDGTPLTSEDVKASYRRLTMVFDGAPPPALLDADGVRQVRAEGRMLSLLVNRNAEAIAAAARAHSAREVEVAPVTLTDIFLDAAAKPER